LSKHNERESNEYKFYKANLEKELGETIIDHGLIHVMKCSDPSFHQDAWCMGLLTERNLILQSGESENWFSLLMNQRSKQKEKEHPLLTIPLESIRSGKRLNRKGWLERWIHRPVIYQLKWESRGKEALLVMELDPTGMELIAPLIPQQ